MTHRLVTGIFIGNILLGYAVHASSDKTENRVYKPIAAQGAALEIDHGLRRVDLTKGEKYSADVMEAQRDGAIGAITLKIVDQDGNVVSNALVRGGFYNHDKRGYGFDKTVGPDGLVELKNRCVGDLHFSIEKDGYYKTSFVYWFFKAWYDCVKDKRWIPWNPTIEVVLKRKVNPVAMYCKTVTVPLPAKGKDFGFDCKAGDLVKPYGKGSESDFFLNYSLVYDTNNVWNATNHLHITFLPHDGAVLMKADTKSQMRTVSSAPETGYMKQISFYLKSETRLRQEKKEFLADDYIVFKSRTEIDANGCETNAHFGKIVSRGFWYGEKSKDGIGGRVTFSYYLNPTPNDRNLEFDGKTNLFKPDWRDTAWPNDP